MTNEARAAKLELREYRNAVFILAKLEENIANVRARLASTSRPAREVDDIQANHDNKATEGLLVALADLTAFYGTKWVETERMCLQLENRIGQVSGIPGLILRMRYIQSQPLDQVADELGYSYRQVLRLHVAALDAYSKTAFYVT